MPARRIDLEVQYLVSAVSSSLPPIASIDRYFQCLCRQAVNVENAGEEYIVTVKAQYAEGYIFSRGLLWPSIGKSHIVGGYRVLVHLVVPDVHGCEVTVRERHVEVNVGPEAITAIKHDQHWRDVFFNSTLFSPLDALSVCCADSGYITVKHVSSESLFFTWVWELFTVDRLIELLSPFKALFQKSPVPFRGRCLDRCGSWLASPGASPGSGGCRNDVHIKLSRMGCALTSKDTYLRKMRAAYPGVHFTCDTSQGTLKLSGEDDAVKKATQHALNFARNLLDDYVQLTVVGSLMMKNRDTQSWFQQCLDSKDILCAWEHLPGNMPNTSPVLAITALEQNIQMFKRIFRSSFQTTEIVLSVNQVDRLQSDLWKQFHDDLVQPKESTIVPVVRVEQNKITVCDLASNIHNTRRAVLQFFYRNQNELQQNFSEEVTEMITKLQPWQVKFLGNDQVKKRLPQCLQQTMSAATDMKAVRIQAPVHMIDRCVSEFWSYVVDLSQQVIPLTAACTQVLQMSDSRERVQGVLNEEGVACDWYVEQGRLIIAAHDTHMQQLKELFTSEIETCQLAAQAKKQEDKEPEADVSRKAVERSQQDYKHHQNGKQQTVTTHKKDQQTRSEITPEERGAQTEDRISTESKERETRIKIHHDKGQQAAKTREQTQVTQTRHHEHREQQTKETMENTARKQSRGWSTGCLAPEGEMAAEGEHRPRETTKHPTEEELAENTETHITQNHRQREDRGDLKDHQSHNSWDGPPEVKESSLEASSLTFLKPVFNSQGNGTEKALCGHTSLSGVFYQPDPSLLRGEVSSLPSTRPHTPLSRVPERSQRPRIPFDINTSVSAVSDSDILSSHGSDISASSSLRGGDVSSSSSSDPKLFKMGSRYTRRETVSYRNSSSVSTIHGCPSIYPLQPNVYVPISPTPVDLFSETDTSSVNSTRASTPSLGQAEGERNIGQLAPEINGSRTFSAAGLHRAQNSQHPVTQQTRDPRGSYNPVTPPHPLTVTPAPRFLDDSAQSQRNTIGQSSPVGGQRSQVPPRRRHTQGDPYPPAAVPDNNTGIRLHNFTPPTVRPLHHEGRQRTRSGRRYHLDHLRMMEETSQGELSSTSSHLEYEQYRHSSRHRRRRQHHPSDCLHGELLDYVLHKLDHPESRCSRSRKARERNRFRGPDIRSENLGEARDGSRERQVEGVQNPMLQQMTVVVQMLSQLQQQLNDNTSNNLMIENASDTETVSSTVSSARSQRRRHPQQRHQAPLQQQNDSVSYDEVFCVVM